jgi:serine/threonine protein kinase
MNRPGPTGQAKLARQEHFMGTPFIEKRLAPRTRSEPEAIARFRAETALLGLLGGRVTPALLEAGEDERGPFVRMEKIELPTVAERLDAAGGAPLDPAWIERAFPRALEALAVLHEGDPPVVHADLSPSNLAVSEDGMRVVILDLGLACWSGAPARDGAFRGTIAYAAPEVARGEPPTPRSDLYSLAAVFLHATTGEVPRAEASATGQASFAAALASAAERPILERRHAQLAARGRAHAAMLACLAHEPDARPASARETC